MKYNAKILKNSKDIHKYNKIILPGVGSFERASTILKKKNFYFEIKNYIKKKNNHILGICLGMQILLNDSEEKIDKSQKNIGLGLIDGKVKKFSHKKKISNIGWSDIKINSKKNVLFESLANNISPLYFVHQYFCKVTENRIVTSMSKFDKINFCSSFQKKNIFGVQFHPEKSSKFGELILKNFLDL